MNGSLFEKGFLLTSIALLGFACVSVAAFFGYTELSTSIFLPFVAFGALLMVMWDELMCPEKMLVIEGEDIILYGNLFAIIFSLGKRMKINEIQRLMLTEGYLTIHTVFESKKPLDLWFPDDMTEEMRKHIQRILPEALAGKFINI